MARPQLVGLSPSYTAQRHGQGHQDTTRLCVCAWHKDHTVPCLEHACKHIESCYSAANLHCDRWKRANQLAVTQPCSTAGMHTLALQP